MKADSISRPARSRVQDITGEEFGLLTVEGLDRVTDGKAYWRCKCKCGGKTVVITGNLRCGTTESCGCLKAIKSKEANETHGAMSHDSTPEMRATYASWRNMRDRCHRRTHRRFRDYGGRGIKVCRRWNRFENFLADMGVKPSLAHTIERKENDGNYEPRNCCWLKKGLQASNRRSRYR